MTEIVYEHHTSLPGYSLPYLINGDDSGLDKQDKKRIDSFMEYYYHLVGKNESLVINVDSEEGFFCGAPVFGLACTCYECTIVILG